MDDWEEAIGKEEEKMAWEEKVDKGLGGGGEDGLGGLWRRQV